MTPNIVPTPATRRLAQILVDAAAADGDDSPADVTLARIDEVYDVLTYDQFGALVALLLGYQLAKPTEQIRREEFTEEQLREGARIFKRWTKEERAAVMAEYPHDPETRWIVDARRQYDLWCRAERKRRDQEAARAGKLSRAS